MPDISMCDNTSCPSNKYCYRFTATPSKYMQAYASFTLKEGETSCSDFWKNGLDSEKCENVHGEGNTCSSNDCKYPKCVDEKLSLYNDIVDEKGNIVGFVKRNK